MPLTATKGDRDLLTHVDAKGAKSLQPQSENAQPRARPGAVMEIAAPDRGVLDIIRDTAVTEGRRTASAFCSRGKQGGIGDHRSGRHRDAEGRRRGRVTDRLPGQ
jgi:hypothetical protein